MAEFTFPDLEGLKTRYDRDGYAIVRKVLDPAFIGELESHIAWLMEKHPDLKPETLGHWLIAEDAFWVRFLSDDRLLDIAEQIVGSDIALFAADYICKRPGSTLPLRWHQDANYWPLVPMEVATFWFAVSESGPHNGGVRIIPESHKHGLINHLHEDRESNLLPSAADPSLYNESEAINLELQPGDISMHHPLTLHGSSPNTSDIWRKGGSIQYMPPTTQIVEDGWPSAFLFRGNPVQGINTYCNRPRYVEGQHMEFAGCEAWK